MDSIVTVAIDRGVRPLQELEMRTHIEELYMPQSFPEEVLLVLGGHAAGLRAPVHEMTGKVYIGPEGLCNGDRYEIRRVMTHLGPMRALVVTSISDAQAAEHYLALSRIPDRAEAHVDSGFERILKWHNSIATQPDDLPDALRIERGACSKNARFDRVAHPLMTPNRIPKSAPELERMLPASVF